MDFTMQFQPHDQNYNDFRTEYWETPLQREWPLHIFCVEEVSRCKPTKLYHVRQEYLVLVMILGGSLRFLFQDRSVVLQAGDAMVIPEMEEYGFESRSTGGVYRKLVTEIEGAHLGSLAGMLGIDGPEVFRGRAGIFHDMVERARFLLSRRNSEELPELLGLSYQLLSRIALEHAEPESPDDRLLSSARLMLEKDFQHPLPVPEIARSLGVSRSRLDRLFREKLQQSPLEYRIRKKMERAAYLLGTALSVKEVAFLLGYCNQFHFSNEFKRFHGVSPQIYQQGSEG